MATEYTDLDVGGTGGAGTIGDPYRSCEDLNNNLAASNTYLVKGTQVLTSGIVWNSVGSKGNEPEIVGTNSSYVEDGTLPVIDANSAVATAFTIPLSTNLRNFEIKNTTSHAVVTSGQDSGVRNLLIYSSGNRGINAAGKETGYSGLTIYSTTGQGFFGGDNNLVVRRSFIYSVGSIGIYGAHDVSGCVIHNTTTGVQTAIRGSLVTNCSFNDLTTGILAQQDGMFVDNCRFTNITTGVNGSAVYVQYGNNFFYTVGTKYNLLGSTSHYPDVDGTSDGYADESVLNFNLSSGGEGVGIEIAVGVPGSTNKAYLTQGANLPAYSVPPDEIVVKPKTIMIGKMDSTVTLTQTIGTPVLIRITNKIAELIALMTQNNGYSLDYGSVDEYDPDNRTYPASFLNILEEEGEDEDTFVIDRYPVRTPLEIRVMLDNQTTLETSVQRVISDFSKLFGDNLATLQAEGMELVDYINRTIEYTNVDAYPAQIIMTWSLKYRRQKTAPYTT